MSIKLTIILSMMIVSNIFSQPNYIFEGGQGDKNDSYTHHHTSNFLFEGGDGSGYNVLEVNSTSNFLFQGGIESGYASRIETSIIHYLFEGDENDGYSSTYHIEPFIWTGGVGTSWTVPGNWNYNVIPDISRKTIIPADVPFYPHVNIGLLSIGKNPNNGLYKAKELWVQEGALLVTRVNCKIENYGLIIVDGEVQVRNTVYNALINKDDGHIQINSAGTLRFQ